MVAFNNLRNTSPLSLLLTHYVSLFLEPIGLLRITATFGGCHDCAALIAGPRPFLAAQERSTPTKHAMSNSGMP
jgi:hypothetical protein